jgi:Serine-threonine protein kinase 19
MSFKFSAAHSSRIKKPTKPPAFKRNSSSASPYSSLPRRKPLQRTSTKPEKADDEDEVGPNFLGVLIPLIAMSRDSAHISSRLFQERLHNATREMNISLFGRTNIHTSTDTAP